MTCDADRETLLRAQGWTRRFLAEEPRLGEAVAHYQGLGFEVRLEPVDPGACAGPKGCAACFQAPGQADRFRIIYTRPAAGAARPAAPQEP